MKKLPVIFGMAFVMALVLNAVLMTMGFFVKEYFEGTPVVAGWIVACYSIAYVVACILCQKIISRWPAQKSLVVSLACMFAGGLLMFYAKNVMMLFLGQGVCGVGTAFLWPPLMGWMSEGLEGDALARTTGFYNLSWSTGVILSPIVAGTLSDYDARYPIVLGVVLYTLMFAVAIWVYVNSRSKSRRSGSRVKEELPQGKETLIRYPAWVGGAAAWFATGFLTSIYPLAAEDVIGISRAKIGGILVFRALFCTISMTLMGLFPFWQFKMSQLVLGHLVLGICAAFLGYTREPVIAIILISIIGLTSAQAYTNSLFHGVSGSRDRTGRMAIHEILLSVGSVAGSASGGIVYQYMGLAAACWIIMGLMLLAAVFDVFCWKKMKL